jgi:hypothetical protein
MSERPAITRHGEFLFWLGSRRGFHRYADGGPSLRRHDSRMGRAAKLARKRNRRTSR